MAFNRDYLQPVGAQSGFGPGMWSYKTDDAAGAVDAANYFALAGDVLKLGDIIFRTTVTNLGLSTEAFSTGGIHVVNAKTGPSAGVWTIDTTNALAYGTIDSD